MLGAAIQIAAPEAAFLFLWTGLAAASVAAIAVLIDPRLGRRLALAPPAAAAFLVGGWLLVQGHSVFLGVGMDLPGALGVIALLIVMFVQPLGARTGRQSQTLLAVAGACLALALATALIAQSVLPAQPPEASETDA